MGTGEELDLVGAVGPEMREADDRAVDDRDERVELGIGALEVQAGGPGSAASEVRWDEFTVAAR